MDTIGEIPAISIAILRMTIAADACEYCCEYSGTILKTELVVPNRLKTEAITRVELMMARIPTISDVYNLATITFIKRRRIAFAIRATNTIVLPRKIFRKMGSLSVRRNRWRSVFIWAIIVH
jgi:hypothetical protein